MTARAATGPAMRYANLLLLVSLSVLLGAACAGNEAGDGDTGVPAAETLKAMTFNLRTGLAFDGADSWLFRRELVGGVVTSEAPEVMGTQEGWAFQLDFIQKSVPGTEWVGTSRRGSAFEEHCAVFYRTDRFRLLHSGTFWLSDSPDEPGTKFSAGQGFPRIATWTELESRAGGQIFFVFNTHLDNYREEQVHERSASLLVRQVERIAAGAPTLLTGDFNEPVGGPAYEILTGKAEFDGVRGSLVDPWKTLGLAEEGTFHGFDGVANGPSRIDWVLASPGFLALAGEVLHDQVNGRYPSDHFPVAAAFAFAPR